MIKLEVDRPGSKADFWLTGSQQFHAMQSISESLAGRVTLLRLPPMHWREVWLTDQARTPFLPSRSVMDLRGAADPQFDNTSLAEEIWLGGYPRLRTDEALDRDLFLSSYYQTYLQRDVRDLLRIGDLRTFDKFVRACAARSGQLLNLSNLARDVDVSVPTAKSWLSVLEASYIVYLLRPFYSNRTKRLVKAPKLYFLDTGLASYLTGWTSPQTLMAGAAAGAMVETWVIGEILKSWWGHGREAPISYFRNKEGTGIDVIFEQDGLAYPLEIKRAATVKRSWNQSFSTLDRLGIPRGEGAIVCLTHEDVPIDDRIRAVPFGVL